MLVSMSFSSLGSTIGSAQAIKDPAIDDGVDKFILLTIFYGGSNLDQWIDLLECFKVSIFK